MLEHELKRSVTETMQAIRSAGCLAAAGAPLPTALHLLLMELNTSVIATLACA